MAAVDDESLFLEEEKLQHSSSMDKFFDSTWFLLRSLFLSLWFIQLIMICKMAPLHVYEMKLVYCVVDFSSQAVKSSQRQDFRLEQNKL